MLPEESRKLSRLQLGKKHRETGNSPKPENKRDWRKLSWRNSGKRPPLKQPWRLKLLLRPKLRLKNKRVSRRSCWNNRNRESWKKNVAVSKKPKSDNDKLRLRQKDWSERDSRSLPSSKQSASLPSRRRRS